MTVEKEEKESVGNKEVRLFELGYHFVPLITPETLGGEVTALKDMIESHSGVSVSDEFPKAMTLAFPLSRMIENKKKVFTSSYFGWMRFQMNPAKLPLFEQELKKNEKIIRFLLIKVSHEKPLSPRRLSFLGKGKPSILTRKESSFPKKVEPAMTEEELEKTIEELVGK